MSSIVKLVSPMNRRDHLSRAEFQHHYVQGHTKLATGYEGNFKYVASTTIQAANGDDPAFDALAQMWFENLDVLKQEYDKPVWDASRKDQPKMITGRIMMITQEFELMKPPAPGEAVMYAGLIHRADKMKREDFRNYWLDTHAPLALKTPGLLGYRACPAITGAVGDGLLRKEGEAPAFDGLVQMWFESVEAFRQTYDSAFWERLWVDHYGNFCMSRVQMLCKEHLVFDHTAKG